ncbi:Development/cell death domain, Galactose oxidase, beta-propeller [Thalictrum thalictroides]|uniref:Development/cell death domain, Galactose oxidase, beta-propeller n=1 Tax=Thalictrum thalictroides TaxID=46969 RepID=A0A7J6XDR6_THATH|nr:Development/cell death domain, Galactose oxidase, beta-propeller [Thalictrum thalictroides]
MGAGRKTETYTADEGIMKNPYSISARNLSKARLGGVIFGCTHYTIKECLSNLVFGLPAPHFSYIRNIEPGLPLFLFNYSDRKLHGIYEAAGHGKMNINPYGWTTNGSDQTQYPAQVRVRIRKQCQFLLEEQYKVVLHANYSDQKYFRFELDHAQTGELLSLFKSSPSTSSPTTFTYYSPMRSSQYGVVPNTLSEPTSELPHSWSSLFKPDFDARTEREGKLLVLEANWEEKDIVCLEKETGPSDITPCWEEQTWPSWEEKTDPSGDAFGWEEEQQISKNQTEREGLQDEEDKWCWKDACYPAAHSATEREDSSSLEYTHDSCVPCEPNNSHLEIESPPITSSTSEKDNSNSEDQTKDAFDSFGTEDCHFEDSHSFASLPMSEKCEDVLNNSSDIKKIIYELRQELKEVKTCSMKQHRKTSAMEKKLADSGILFQHLRHRFMLLESNLQDTAKGSDVVWNGTNNNKLLAKSFDKPCLGIDEFLYIFGGYDGVEWLSTLDCYWPSSDTLKCLSPMSSARSYASAVVLNGHIFNIGGWNDFGKMWLDTGASLNNKIYAIGGGNGVDIYKEVEMFDPELGRWIPTQSMLRKRFASALVELDGVLYVAGGYDGRNYLKSAERFDPREASWSKLQGMNTSRGSHALTVLKGKIYALGGYDGNKYVPSVEVFDPCMGTWLAGEEMKQSRGYFAAPIVGEAIYAIGGQNADNDIVESVETYRLGHGWSATNLKGIGKKCFFSAVVY